METEEIIEKLGLNYRTDWKWQIVMTSAAKREGIDEALKCIHMCLIFKIQTTPYHISDSIRSLLPKKNFINQNKKSIFADKN
ncbi:hypothetical protein PVAND_016799 [Polypedilum vanderplanki]|uniref:Uncharacterized protein n=1 Tax=Polypedilum vanderplanki TaxID=319348 RepID=A0A9J6BH22_POLVA|nr:hypothetical protein PVAND_016799 [Polypedilum vanderplanki]